MNGGQKILLVILSVLIITSTYFTLNTFTGKSISSQSQGVTKTYIYAGTLAASKSSDSPTETTYYIQDHLGSNKKIVDGEVEQSDDFYAFGEARISEGSENDYKFTGKELDAETGLYYYGARYYSPELGRFIQSDALKGSFGDPLSFNRYAYVKNNPLKFVDPTGNGEKSIENTFMGLNILAPMVASVYKGVERGDGFGDIVKNSLIAGASSGGSFFLKSNLGKMQEEGVPFIGIRAANDLLTSVTNNAIRGVGTFDSISFNIFPPITGRYEKGDLNLGIDLGQTVGVMEIMGAQVLGISKINLAKTLQTGAFYSETESGVPTLYGFDAAGLETEAGIIVSENDFFRITETHEKIHLLQNQQIRMFSLSLQGKSHLSERIHGVNFESGGFRELQKNNLLYTWVGYPVLMSEKQGGLASPYRGITYEGEAAALDDNHR